MAKSKQFKKSKNYDERDNVIENLEGKRDHRKNKRANNPKHLLQVWEEDDDLDTSDFSVR